LAEDLIAADQFLLVVLVSTASISPKLTPSGAIP